jgi:hypothetical protein
VVFGPDLLLQRDGDVLVVSAQTSRGIDFVDAYTALELEVKDSGEIEIPLADEFALRTRASEAGLVIADDP